MPGFWKHIHSDKNPSLWKNLRCNGDGLWLREGLCSESLLIVHDESYMKKVSSHVCSAAVMIVCESTGSICKCTIAEYSLSASSYCGEILGAILTQLVLLAVVKGRMGPYPMVAEDCNNNGVVLHGNKPFHPLPRSQTQPDVLQVMKFLIAHQPFAVHFLYATSHLDNIKEWSECTIKEGINIKVNKLAKKALIHAHLCSTYFDGNFPLEDFTIFTNRKVTGPDKLSLED